MPSKQYIDGIEVEKCPLRYVTEIEKIRLEAYHQYKNGFLPNAGGWLDQPMKFIQIITLIDNALESIREKAANAGK